MLITKGGRVWGNAPMTIGNCQDEDVKAEGIKAIGNCRGSRQ